MGKAGRFACIFVPMVLTIASLVCQILVFSGQTNKDMSLPRDLWFFKAVAKDFNRDPTGDLPDIPNTDLDNKLLQALQGVSTDKELKDFYLVGLWNYCEGDIKNDDKYEITHCSGRKANFWFNPVDVWELKNTTADELFPDKLQDGLNAYEKASKWMFTAFVIAICLTLAEFVVGIFAIFSRWGSLVTTIISTAQTVFMLAAAISATAIYAILAGVFESVLKPYNIRASLGRKMYITLWFAAAFSIASGFFWLISVCCCSGKSGHKKVNVEKTPYTYERVASPYLGARDGGHQLSSMPSSGGHGTSGSAYEPFRHDNRV